MPPAHADCGFARDESLFRRQYWIPKDLNKGVSNGPEDTDFFL